MQVSPTLVAHPTASTFDDYLNLDLTSPLIDSSLISPQDHPLHGLFSPLASDASPQSTTTTNLLPPTPDYTFNDLFRAIEPPKQPYEGLGEGAFSFADLFASTGYANEALFQPAQNQPSTSTPQLPFLPSSFAIDPALVATPALPSISVPAPPSVPRSTATLAESDDESDEDEDEEGDDLSPLPSKRKSHPSVAKGGIVKRSGSGGAAQSCVVRDAESNDPDDWRPTPEEYKKLSSKEKRQLRNKISARNFRVRRKEYITTLEGQISDRDKLISAIRSELGQSQSENAELRQEIDNLKRAMLEGRAPPPTGLPPPSSSSSISPSPKRSTRTPLARANPNKDGGFWGGQKGMGGVTSVHSVVLPDIGPAVLSGKNWTGMPLATATLGTLPGHWRTQPNALAQENINPQLNSILRALSNPSSPSSASEAITPPPQKSPELQLLQEYPGSNTFNLKAMEATRMQLWAKMAAAGHVPPAQNMEAQAQAQLNAYAAQQYAQQNTLTGLLRPAFFKSPESSSSPSLPLSSPKSLSSLMSGKASSSLSSSPSPSPSPAPNALVASAANAASKSLVSRMGSVFWNAFSGASGEADPEKVRKVLEGRAVLRVVDVERVDEKRAPSEVGLEERMKGLAL